MEKRTFTLYLKDGKKLDILLDIDNDLLVNGSSTSGTVQAKKYYLQGFLEGLFTNDSICNIKHYYFNELYEAILETIGL